jgi:hypothetical protein
MDPKNKECALFISLLDPVSPFLDLIISTQKIEQILRRVLIIAFGK